MVNIILGDIKFLMYKKYIFQEPHASESIRRAANMDIIKKRDRKAAMEESVNREKGRLGER